MSQRSEQLNKEALATVGLYIFSFCWWYFFAYVYQSTQKFYGLPSWFFLSCVVGLAVNIVAVILVVKFFFKEIKLD